MLYPRRGGRGISVRLRRPRFTNQGNLDFFRFPLTDWLLQNLLAKQNQAYNEDKNTQGHILIPSQIFRSVRQNTRDSFVS
jgi:hypothetical protein